MQTYRHPFTLLNHEAVAEVNVVSGIVKGGRVIRLIALSGGTRPPGAVGASQ